MLFKCSCYYNYRFDDLITVEIRNDKLKNGSYYFNVSSCADETCVRTNYNVSQTYEFSIQEIENHALGIATSICLSLFVLTLAFLLAIFYLRRKMFKPSMLL